MSRRALRMTAMVLGVYIAGCIALQRGTTSSVREVGVAALVNSQDASMHSGDLEGESYPESNPYLEDGAAILVGVSSAFCAFWKLQSGAQRAGGNMWLVVLIFSFLICVYGFGLLLELAAGS